LISIYLIVTGAPYRSCNSKRVEVSYSCLHLHRQCMLVNMIVMFPSIVWIGK